jgi:hypothetical protein
VEQATQGFKRPIRREGHDATRVTVVSDISKPQESDEAAAQDYIVVVGGLGSNSKTTNDIDVYDVEGKAWLKVSSTFSDPDPSLAGASRCRHTVTRVSTIASGVKLLLFGGAEHTGDTKLLHNDVRGLRFIDDMTRAHWFSPRVTGVPPAPREGHSTSRIGSNLFVIGGFDGSDFRNDVHVLEVDPDDFLYLTWVDVSVSGRPPPLLTGHTATAISNNRIVVYGGRNTGGPLEGMGSVHVLTVVGNSTETEASVQQDASLGSAISGRSVDESDGIDVLRMARAALKRVAPPVAPPLPTTGCGGMVAATKTAAKHQPCILHWASCVVDASLTPFPRGRFHHTTSQFGNVLLVFGGATNATHDGSPQVLDEILVLQFDEHNDAAAAGVSDGAQPADPGCRLEWHPVYTSGTALPREGHTATNVGNRIVLWAGRKGEGAAGLCDDMMSLDMDELPRSGPQIEPDQLKLLDRIGVGAFGEVFAGVMSGRHTIAVKRMCCKNPSESAKFRKAVQTFQNEVRVGASLTHPHIVRCFGGSVKDKDLCVLMELLPFNLASLLHPDDEDDDAAVEFPTDGSLQGDYCKVDWLGPSGYTSGAEAGALPGTEPAPEAPNTHAQPPPLSPADRIRVAKEIAEGMRYAHKRNVIHFDLKPQNILCPGHLGAFKRPSRSPQ